MFGLGFTEIVVIFVVALIFLGPKELPRLGSQLGKFLRAINMAKHEFEAKVRDLNQEITHESHALTQPVTSAVDTLKTALKPAESISKTLSGLSAEMNASLISDKKEDQPA